MATLLASFGASIESRGQEIRLLQPNSTDSGSSYGWQSSSLVGPKVADEQPWQSAEVAVRADREPFWTPALHGGLATASLDQPSSVEQQGYGSSSNGSFEPTGLSGESCRSGCGSGPRDWQLMPEGLIYRAYLAGEKESRIRSVWNYDTKDGWIWDISLGGRAGILRYGTMGDARPEGFQVDIEGAGLTRLDLEEDRDVDAVDFRFGVPITYGTSEYQVKLAYYHLSSHLGDEYLLKHPGYPRLNYSRDELVLGGSYYTCPELRFYAEAGWAFMSDVAEPWEFQFGFDYAPASATGVAGAPFVAVNGHLRQEVDFGGNLVGQAGWAWRRSPSSGMFRAGVQYFNGQSEQFSFFARSESKLGLALWYDF